MGSLGIKVNALTFNAYQLKLIAIIAMVVDHVGAVFFPQVVVFRAIGRLTAPLMAFFIAEGYLKTRDVKKYMLRIFIFAIISMLPYYWVFGHSSFNILFDLLLGLIVIEFSHKLKREYLRWGLVLLVACIAIILQTDGRLGISTLIYLFYRFRQDKRSLIGAMIILYFGVLAAYMLYGMGTGQVFLLGQATLWLRPLSLLSLPLIFRYNGERGMSLKYLFYAFYPAHLLFIYILMSLL